MSDSQSYQSTGWHFNNQKLGRSCVCVLLCCCYIHHRDSGSRYRGHHFPRNYALFHLWTLLLGHCGYRRRSLGRHGYWTASPPALGALWLRSVASGDRPSSSPVEGSSGMKRMLAGLPQSVNFNKKQTEINSPSHILNRWELLVSPESPWLCQLGHRNRLPVINTKWVRWWVFLSHSEMSQSMYLLCYQSKSHRRHGHTCREVAPSTFCQQMFCCLPAVDN